MVEEGQVEVLERLLAEDPSCIGGTPDGSTGLTPLHVACHYNQEAAAAVLLKRGADVNADGTRSKAKVAVTSRVIAVEGTEREVPGLFPKDNDHNLCYLIVDPSKRRVVVWRNAWTSIW